MKNENWELKIDPNNLHHAYLIVGDRESVKAELFNFLKDKLKIQITGNPDFLYFDSNTLTIDEAREIARMQEMRGFSPENNARKFFVIGTNIITIEAQNALLKVFEEPTLGTHFFILASQNTFLPTFLSRLQVVRIDTNRRIDTNETNGQRNIIKKSITERLLLVAKLAGDISDEKKVKQDAIELVNQIEFELSSDVQKNSQQLKECQFARTALFSRGAMTKMILENLM